MAKNEDAQYLLSYKITMMVSAVIFTVLGYRILKELERIK